MIIVYMKYRVIFGLSQCVTQFASNSKHRALGKIFVIIIYSIPFTVDCD